jgi:hypothetical protein
VVQMRSLEHLGDILPAKHDIHTEPLSGRRHCDVLLATKWTRLSVSRFLLSSTHESLRANGFKALMHEREKKPARAILRSCRVWMLCRSQPVLIRLDVNGE